MTGPIRVSSRQGGGLGPLAVVVVMVAVVAVVALRQIGGSSARPGASTAPDTAAPAIPTAAASTASASSATPAASGEVTPTVVGKRTIDVANPTTLSGVPLGDLLSVSPDGRNALLWSGTPGSTLDQVELLSMPLTGGSPVDLGTAGFQRAPDSGEFTLALPAWAADGMSVAFENKSAGTVVGIDGGAIATFAATPDAPISPLSAGGFLVDAPNGPAAVGGPGPAHIPSAPSLSGVAFFEDGSALVGSDSSGALVWSSGSASKTIALSPGGASHGWQLVARAPGSLMLVPSFSRLDRAEIVDAQGNALLLHLPDACGTPSVSDDGAYAAYTVCDNSGTSSSYGLRVVRLSDGAAVDVGQAAASPRFIPGTHRLAWVTLQGSEPPTQYVLTVAQNEVLP